MITFLLTNKKRDLSPIAILVNFQGLKYKKCIGESISPSKWNEKKKRVKITYSNPEGQIINDRIDKWEKAAYKTINYFKGIMQLPSYDDFFSKLKSTITNNKTFKKVSIYFSSIFKYLFKIISICLIVNVL